MYLKRYTVVAVLWIALVGWYVYSYITQASMGIDFFGIPLPSLRIAVWIVLPLVVLYLASLFHMMFYSMIGNFKLRKYEKDYAKILDEIVDRYLGKEVKHYNFKTERYKLLGTLLENSALYPIGNLRGKIRNEKIERVIDAIETIKSGEVADLKPFNLPFENELVIQNSRNKYKKGELKAEDILSGNNKYAEKLRQEIYIDYVKTAPFDKIKKYQKYVNKEALNIILNRINATEYTLRLSNEDLVSLFDNVELTKEEYIQVSKDLSKTGIIPEQRIKLFETLSEEHEEAIDAYLYTLYDLEMLSLANAILDNSQPDEYLNFKAYRVLKESGENYSINLFV